MDALPGVTQGDNVKLRCEGSAAGQTTGSASQVEGGTTCVDSAVGSSVAASAGACVFAASRHSETGSCWQPSASASLIAGQAREDWRGCPLL